MKPRTPRTCAAHDGDALRYGQDTTLAVFVWRQRGHPTDQQWLRPVPKVSTKKTSVEEGSLLLTVAHMFLVCHSVVNCGI